MQKGIWGSNSKKSFLHCLHRPSQPCPLCVDPFTTIIKKYCKRISIWMCMLSLSWVSPLLHHGSPSPKKLFCNHKKIDAIMWVWQHGTSLRKPRVKSWDKYVFKTMTGQTFAYRTPFMFSIDFKAMQFCGFVHKTMDKFLHTYRDYNKKKRCNILFL